MDDLSKIACIISHWFLYLGPELCGADPVDVMCSPGSEGPGEDPSVEYVYCRGVITELIKYGPTDLHAVSKGPNPPKMLILVIPGRMGHVSWQKQWLNMQISILKYRICYIQNAKIFT